MGEQAPAATPPLFNTVLLLFRKDLRVYDNPALLAASQAANHLIPVYVWSPEEEGQFQPGRCSRWWLKQTLVALEEQLGSLGSRLIIRRSQDSTDMLLELLQETGGQAVFFNHLFDPISLVRDHNMKQRLTAAGYTCRSYNADLLYEPWEVLDDAGEPFHTFKTFWSKLQSMPRAPPSPFPAPSALPAVSPQLHSCSLDELALFTSREQEDASNQLGNKWCPGAAGGLARLNEFLSSQLAGFSCHKANVDRAVTSRLSPWIHVGSVSVRHIYHKVKAKQHEWLLSGVDHSSCCQEFIQQLAYREYSRYLSFHFPFLHERPLLSHLRCVPWNLDQLAFKAWKMGMTGVPLVDAAMKELWSSGWMHNRLRVVCGVFAVKHLLLPWQWGLKHYWDALLDADLESDALGWQYVAGCMIDAPPFDELKDIVAESAAFDPDGEFVRRWLPVLARVPTTYIHAPWAAPPSVLDAADVELGLNYPYPLVTQQVAAARVAQVAAIIQDSLQQQDQQLDVSKQQQQQQQVGIYPAARQPYRPATSPMQSYKRRAGNSGTAADVAAAAAAADMQRCGSVLMQQQSPSSAAGTGGGAGTRPPHQYTLAAAGHHAAAAAQGPGAVQGNHDLAVQGNHEWQQLAVQGDIHLRHRQQQRQMQQQQRHKRRRQQQQHWKYVCGDGCGDGEESEGSVESEVFSSAPVVSEVQPTACSGVRPQQQQQQQRSQRQKPMHLCPSHQPQLQRQQLSVGQELSKELRRQSGDEQQSVGAGVMVQQELQQQGSEDQQQLAGVEWQPSPPPPPPQQQQQQQESFKEQSPCAPQAQLLPKEEVEQKGFRPYQHLIL